MADPLIRLADKATPALRRAVQTAIAAATSAARLGQGSDERTILSAWAEEAVPRIDAAMRDMQQQVMSDAGRATMRQVSPVQAWRYDAVNPRAVQYVQDHAGELIAQITETQRQAVRQAIGRVVGAEISVGQAAKHLRSVVGLTTRMEQAVWNLRAKTLASGVPPRKADVTVARYRDRLIRERAETIARTETIRSLNAGRVEAWQQAIESGLLPASTEKKWVVAFDDRLCPICAPLSGERVPMGDPFSVGVDYPPAHPRCRCSTSVVRVRDTSTLRVTRVDRVPVLR